jgi:hypothetical protein
MNWTVHTHDATIVHSQGRPSPTGHAGGVLQPPAGGHTTLNVHAGARQFTSGMVAHRLPALDTEDKWLRVADWATRDSAGATAGHPDRGPCAIPGAHHTGCAGQPGARTVGGGDGAGPGRPCRPTRRRTGLAASMLHAVLRPAVP